MNSIGGLQGWPDVDPRLGIILLAEFWRTDGPSPLAPILVAYAQSRPAEVHTEQRRYAIVPNAVLRKRVDTAALPGFLEQVPIEHRSQIPNTGYLPGLAPIDGPDVPPVFTLYDAVGRSSLKAGKGAPLEVRLWLEAMMFAPPGQREGNGSSFQLSLRELFDALWPNGYRRGSYPYDHLRRALTMVNNARIPTVIRGTDGKDHATLWLPVVIRGMPVRNDRDSLLIVEVTLPPGTGPGAMVDRNALRRYGLEAAPAYRGYLSAALHWNEHGTRNGKPLQPFKRKGKGNQTVENPPAKRYGLNRVFTPDDLVSLAFSPVDLEGKANPRNYRRRAVEVFERMAADGAIILDPAKNDEGAEGYRILRPDGFGQA